jgi:hypothetical protein
MIILNNVMTSDWVYHIPKITKHSPSFKFHGVKYSLKISSSLCLANIVRCSLDKCLYYFNFGSGENTPRPRIV